MKFFSVITCVYNSSAYLSLCLDSVASQTFTDYEHILVYSPSTDDSLKILKTYLKTHSRAKLVVVPPKGVSAAMNAGICTASGKYLIHLHSDDYFINTDVLTRTNDFLIAHSDLDWVYGQIMTDSGRFPNLKPLTMANRCLIKIYNFIPHQAVFIKRTVFKKFGLFDPSLRYCMDYAYWLKICERTHWGFMPICVSYYRRHERSLSSSVSGSAYARVEYHQVQSNYYRNISQLLLIIYKLRIYLIFILLAIFISLRLISMLNHFSLFLDTVKPVYTYPFASKDVKLSLKYPQYYPIIIWLRKELTSSDTLTINCNSINISYLCHQRLTQSLLYPSRIFFDAQPRPGFFLDSLYTDQVAVKSVYDNSLYLYSYP